jgi:hypothetical protein
VPAGAAGATAGPDGVGTVCNAIHKLFNCVTNPDNRSIVVLPNNKGSTASLPPNNIVGELTVKLALVSKLKPLIALNPIVKAELNNIWSLLLLNNKRPEFNIICLSEN